MSLARDELFVLSLALSNYVNDMRTAAKGCTGPEFDELLARADIAARLHERFGWDWRKAAAQPEPRNPSNEGSDSD